MNSRPRFSVRRPDGFGVVKQVSLALLFGATLNVAVGCAYFVLLPAPRANAADSEAAPPPSPDAAYLEARLALSAGHAERARELLEGLRERGEADSHAYATLAEIHMGDSKLAEAAAILDEGVERHPESIRLRILRANLYRMAGDMDQAAELLREAQKLQPHRRAVLESLSDLYLQQLNQAKSREEAREVIDNLIGVYEPMLESREGQERWPVLLMLHELYTRQGRVEEARAAAEQAITFNPRDLRAYLALADTEQAMGHDEEALRALRRALILEPDNVELNQRVIRLLSEKDDADEVIAQFYSDLAREYPTSREIQLLAAEVLLQKGKGALAEERLEHIIELWPDELRAKINLARRWIAEGDIQKAIERTREMIVAEPGLDLQAVRQIVYSLETAVGPDGSTAPTGFYRKQAIELFKAYQERNPSDEDVLIDLYWSLREENDTEQIQSLLSTYRERHPDSFAAVALTYDLYTTVQERFDDAERLLEALPEGVRAEHAEQIKNLRCELYVRHGASLQKTGRLAEAESLYRKALELDPENPLLRSQIYISQGIILQEQGQLSEAEAVYRKALESEPDYAEACNTLGYFYAETNQKLDEALTLVQKAQKLAPDSGHIVDSLGWVLFRRGDFEGAVTQLENATRMMDQDEDAAEVYDHLGDAYEKVGAKDKARLAWEKAMELDTREKFIKRDALAEKIRRNAR